MDDFFDLGEGYDSQDSFIDNSEAVSIFAALSYDMSYRPHFSK